MKKHLHNSDEQFESPQFGWEQMHALLEKNLPQQTTGKKRPLLTLLIAASLLVIFLLSFLVTGNNIQSFYIANSGDSQPLIQLSSIKENSPINQQVNAKKNLNCYHETFAQPVNPVHPAYFDFSDENNAVIPTVEWNEVALFKNEQSSDIFAPGIITDRKTATQNISPVFNNIAIKESVPGRKSILNSKQKGYWELYAGLAVNAVIGEQQNLRPYPAVTARYNISKKVFVSAGLSAASPVAVSSKGIDKTVFVNDTASNVRMYNNVKYYSRLSYADIPLMAGVKIKKKLAIQAGVQASVLLNAKTTSALEGYDFQMSSIDVNPTSVSPGAAAAGQEEYTVKARKVDYRFVAGLQYKMKNASLRLTYQYAPKSALVGEHVSANKNQLVSAGIQIKLK